MQSSKSSNSWLAIGRVARAHGVRGALRVVPFDAAADTLAHAGQVRIGEREWTIAAARRVTGGWLIELDGVATREAADALRGQEIAAPRDDVELAEGEYLVADLVGCEAVDPSGRALGRVQSVFWGGAHEVLVLDGDRMVPLVDEWVIAVDLEARRITVEPHDAF